MTKEIARRFKVKDRISGLWVLSDASDLAGIYLTQDEERARVFEGKKKREEWQKMGYEIIEVSG